MQTKAIARINRKLWWSLHHSFLNLTDRLSCNLYYSKWYCQHTCITVSRVVYFSIDLILSFDYDELDTLLFGVLLGIVQPWIFADDFRNSKCRQRESIYLSFHNQLILIPDVSRAAANHLTFFENQNLIFKTLYLNFNFF